MINNCVQLSRAAPVLLNSGHGQERGIFHDGECTSKNKGGKSSEVCKMDSGPDPALGSVFFHPRLEIL